ncbi:MAG: serine/threonine-protein kinase [Pseudonocardia sp.]
MNPAHVGAPAIFGPYRLLELLGRGGMGEVYRAHDTATDRTVALKLLPERSSADPHYVARFRRECRIAARLNDPHVVPIHGFGEIGGRLYLDMRLVEGTDLAAWLHEHGPLTPQTAVATIAQVARALDAAHAARLVHRDVKPSNVLLAGARTPPLEQPFAYLFDFGIARHRAGTAGPDAVALTGAGAVPGSPSYVAPERWDGVEGEPAADVYALACVLFETLTGRPPFTGSAPALMRAHLQDPPPMPSAVRRGAGAGIPVGFDAVVAKGMAKDPRLRFRTAGALAEAAQRALGPDPLAVRTIRPESTMAGAVTVSPSGSTRIPPVPGPRTAPGAASDAAPDEVTVHFTGTARRRRPVRTRRDGRRRGGVLGGLVVTSSVVAATVAFALLPGSTPLEVTDATVTAAEPGRGCDLTVDVVGTLTTSGGPGTLSYTWTRSDGGTTGVLVQEVAAGQTSVDVHLLWTLSGRGRHDATATLRVLEPNPAQAQGSFTYSCGR